MHQLHSTIVLVEFALSEFLSNVRIKQQEKHLPTKSVFFCTILSTLKSKSIYSNYKNFDKKYDLALLIREMLKNFFYYYLEEAAGIVRFELPDRCQLRSC